VVARVGLDIVVQAGLMVVLCFHTFAQMPQTPQVQPMQQPPPLRRPPGAARPDWRRNRALQLIDDYGELKYYADANARLQPPAAGENRVVFLGDSITFLWPVADSFPGKPYLNRGIGGQTTTQMLVRFRQDVINLQPKVVVILAGTNDIAGNTGPMTTDQIEANYATLAELAKLHNIQVVFGSVTPVHNYSPQAQMFFAQRPMEKIQALNHWLKDYCTANALVYVDYYGAMVDERGLLKQSLSDDGLHPSKAGFAVMTPLAKAAIEKAMEASRKP
jgi:lysophospholipase L1-like esterase